MSRRSETRASLELVEQARQRANAQATQRHPTLERHRKARERRLRTPTWSLPADKVLKAAVVLVAVLAALSWLGWV